MIWKPNVTVAAIIERKGHFLLVEEETEDGIRLNQPAGHLEDGESLLEAAIRETREETGYEFTPTAISGIYRLPVPAKDLTYLRFAFVGEVGETPVPSQPLDEGIIRAIWLSVDEIQAQKERCRSPLVWTCIEDYLAGYRYPLGLLRD